MENKSVANQPKHDFAIELYFELRLWCKRSRKPRAKKPKVNHTVPFINASREKSHVPFPNPYNRSRYV